jgi:Short C-terminal domain
MDATEAIVLLGFVVAVLSLGVGGYLISRTDAFAVWWEGVKERRAASAARMQEQNAALDRELQRGIETPLAPDAVIGGVVERMTREGWSLQNRTDTTASFAQDQGADTCARCLLMLLFILPGILYLLLANRTARVTVAAYPYEGGSRLVIGGDDPATRNRLMEWARGLREGVLSAPVELAPPENRSPAGGTLAEKLQELNGLRDAGLITDEEFEAKKKDLLDRMLLAGHN